MKTKHIFLLLFCALCSFMAKAQDGSPLIQPMPDNGIGKQLVSIHSYSSQTKNEESPANLLQPGGNDKWCDNQTDHPWVVFELYGYYNVDRILFRDAKTKESNSANTPEYWIYVSTTGTADGDWTEVLHKTEVGGQDIKDETFEPVEARYVKFVTTKADGAARIYGFELYGTFSRPIEASGDLVSVGKTVLKFYDAANAKERPLNMLDGNTTNPNSKWCFNRAGEGDSLKYVVIDLGKQYAVSKFILRDCKTLEDNANALGCNIYVSEVMPDLDLIGNLEDKNTCWTEVVDSNNEGDVAVKEYDVTSQNVTGRYVKLVIPRSKTTTTMRIFNFEVYGVEMTVQEDNADLLSLNVPGHALTPLFEKNITEYTLNVKKEVESIVIEAGAFDEEATVEGTGEFDLDFGANRFSVIVTAKDGVTQKAYTLVVNRARQSDIAALSSLSVSHGIMNPQKFDPGVYYYEVDVPYDVTELGISADNAHGATIEGAGIVAIDNPERVFEVKVTAEDGDTGLVYTVKVIRRPMDLISASDAYGRGKRIVNIHSASARASDNESPFKLLLDERNIYSGNTSMKWCDNKTEQPWVIFSLAEMYKVYQIGFRDGKLVENVANTTAYEVYVSTTTTDDDAWTKVAEATGVGEFSTKVASFEPVDARYVKLVLTKGSNAVWIYGVDIYGTLSENRIDRGELISVGKTIVNAPYRWSDRETAANLIDGLESTEWAINRGDGPALVEIDLEGNYDISRFVLNEREDYDYGYKVYTKIALSDEWTEVFSQRFDTDEEHLDRKEGILAEPVTARYVKLEIPKDWMINWSRIREFEIYGTAHAEPVRTYVRQDNVAGHFSTVCLPMDAVAENAVLYVVAGVNDAENPTLLYLSEKEQAAVEAGVPYVFKTIADGDVTFTYTGDEDVASATTVGGLVGVLEDTPVEKDACNYVLEQRDGDTEEWYFVDSEYTCPANYAYLDASSVEKAELSDEMVVIPMKRNGASGLTEELLGEVGGPVDVYTVQGVKVRSQVDPANALDGLTKGVYIVGGKKAIVF